MTTPRNVKKTLWLPEDEVEEFESTFPMHGAMTWFVREALRRFNEMNRVKPEEIVDVAVRDIHI